MKNQRYTHRFPGTTSDFRSVRRCRGRQAAAHHVRETDTAALQHCYADHSVWKSFAPANMTLCSPDPQAFRPPEEPVNVLQVTLPTNFKVARFDSDGSTSILRKLAVNDRTQAVIYALRNNWIRLSTKSPKKPSRSRRTKYGYKLPVGG